MSNQIHILPRADNFEELHVALKDSLDQRGVLNSIRATIRAEIFNALEDQDAVNVNPTERAPSSENLILNELIREYLEYNGYLNTLSVFHPETGQPTKPTGRISREVLVHELGVTDGERAKRVPLLYSVLAKLQVQASRQVGGHVNSSSSSSSSGSGSGGVRGGGAQASSPSGSSNVFANLRESSDNDPLSQSTASRSHQAIGFTN
jgi:lisH domain-containing protein FOPNL